MTTLREAALQFTFNPDQKRGWHGRWVHLTDIVKDMAGSDNAGVSNRLHARQVARDENPNRLDRLAERLNRRADQKMDESIKKAYDKNAERGSKPRKPGEYDNISRRVRRNLENR